ncbi:MAG: lipopolysaccharide heptosyltransferase II [Verrucomicrobiae bacterium]|nr:lipopolysaccharide heptosyltransferase II [Verrucomicrobiae bacterium]
MKILLLKPSSLGDVAQAVPVLRLLRRWRPEAEIWWWIEKDYAALLEGDPDLTGLYRFDRRGWRHGRGWLGWWDTVQQMRSRRFDWVIDLQSLARSGVFAWLANGALLAGLEDGREGAHGFYDLCVPRPHPLAHAVDWYVSVLRRLGVPTTLPFVWLPPRFAAHRSITQRWRPEGKVWVAMAPGARWPNKRWPVEHFSTLARLLVAAHPAIQIVVMGGAADSPLAQAIAVEAPGRILNLAGQTTLPETVEWLRLVSVVVTNDTGPMHIAAALRTPVVALFGPTEPARTGPYGQPQNVLQLSLPCVPCMKATCHHRPLLECLQTLPPARVLERVLALLETSRPPHESRWELAASGGGQ